MIDIFQEEELDQPEDLKSQPDILEDGMVCRDCYVWKPLTEFHQNRQHNRVYYYKNCKPCYSSKMNKAKNYKDPFGSIYRQKPGEYENDYQKEKVFELMIALGWEFNNDKQIWWKKGIKNEDGIFLKVIPDVKKVFRRKTSHGNTPVVYNNIMKNIEDILAYRNMGVPFTELEDIYGCSHTTIRKAVHDYNYEKKTRTH